jgi:phage terminase small subunit
MIDNLLELENRLEKQLESVKDLSNFDRKITDFCTQHLETLNNKYRNAPFNTTNQTYLCENTIKAIKNIRENDSLRSHYNTMHNQCIVLAVSFFTSAISDIFRYSVQKSSELGTLPASNEELKISIKELQDVSFNLTNYVAEIILKKKDISFQDMQSTVRAFDNYLHIKIPKDSCCNDVILAQASRHSIVHNHSIADEKFLNQIKAATPRSIRQSFIPNEPFKYTASEIEFITFAMLIFVQNLRTQLVDGLKIE